MTHGPLQRSPLVQPFYPALDGLRALAVFLVFNYHFSRGVVSSWTVRWCWVGVDLFFVLSGFLITGILYDSTSRPDFFRNFYIRRALRIFPVFYGIWLVLLLLTPILHIQWNRYLGAMALYFGNFFLAGGHLHWHADPGIVHYRSLHHGGVTRGILVDHFWSLCVEEQFYLLWPAVVWTLRSRRALLRLCIVAILITPLARGLYAHLHPQMLLAGALYYNTFARFDTLLFGAALALWLRGPSPSPAQLRALAWAALVGAPALLVLLVERNHVSSEFSIFDPTVSTIGFTLIAIAASGLLLLTIDPLSPLAHLLRLRPLTRMGRISYGFYAYHQLLSIAFNSYSLVALRHHVGLLVPVTGFALTYFLAWLSFVLWETPFLKLKHILAPRPGAVADPPPAGGEPQPESLARSRRRHAA